MFAKRIKDLREEKKLTQADLSKLLEISRTALSSYELGTAVPNIDVLIKMVKFFSVSADYLLGLSSVKKTDESKEALQKVIADIATLSSSATASFI